jgi:hypothetical protein
MRFNRDRMIQARRRCALVLVGLAFTACDDAVCPSGTTERLGHCIQNRELVDAEVGTGGQQASTASAGTSAGTTAGAEVGGSDAPRSGSGGRTDPSSSSGDTGAGGGQSVSGSGGTTGGSSGGAAGGPATPEPKCGNGVREGNELCDGADCSSSCETSNACLIGMLIGSAAMCDARCGAPKEVTECKSGDGCCANDCKYPADTDCSKSCGDGVVDDPELCEPTSTDKPCPTSCDDDDTCTQDIKTGTTAQCNVSCAHMPITSPQSDDGCCPRSANANTDSDCTAICGNGVVESGEKCDGDCPTSSSCTGGSGCSRRMLIGSGCAVECRTVEITERKASDGCCPEGANSTNDSDCKAMCGNRVVESGEKCDGDCATSSSCTGGSGCSRRMLSGSGCAVECKTVEITERKGSDGCCPEGANATNDSDCKAMCGNRVVESGEKCDGDCPTSSSCTGGSGCSRRMLSGSGCAIECKTVEITERRSSDGCCPEGANATNDNDCTTMCGDGVITGDEQCDPKATGWNGTTCASDCRRAVYRRCGDSNDCPGDETCYVGICGKRCTSNDDPVCNTIPNATARCVASNDNDNVCAIACFNEPDACPIGLSQGCVTVALDAARTNPVTICDGLGL